MSVWSSAMGNLKTGFSKNLLIIKITMTCLMNCKWITMINITKVLKQKIVIQ